MFESLNESSQAIQAVDTGTVLPAATVAEPVFGQIKEARGFRRFLLRGLEKAQAEWALVCTGHNLLKLWRWARTQPA